MRISQRLFLAVIPAIVGVFAVAGLAYWGAYHRAAPEWVVVVAAVSAIGSLVLAWRNTRYVALRIERLAGDRAGRERPALTPLKAMREAAMPRAGGAPDELDSIEHVVDQLTSAVSVAEAGSREREKVAAERVSEYALLLNEGAAAVRRQLDETRLALHILQEHHFGALNESQEEMVQAARAGTDAAESEVGRLQEIAQLDRGALTIRRDAVRLADVLQSLRPQLEADASRVGATLMLDVAPGLPRVAGDRTRLQQALALLLQHVVRRASPGAEVTIAAESPRSGGVRIEVRHGAAPTLDADVALARRIIEAHGGRIEAVEGVTTVEL